MPTFNELADSRRSWIDDVLVPWCRKACDRELRTAELDWTNLAGQVDSRATLWSWAWSRFPLLVHDGLSGFNETNELRVTLRTGESVAGFPDNLASRHGNLMLLTKASDGRLVHSGPFNIDMVQDVELSDPSTAAQSVPLPERPLTTMPQFSDPDQRF